MPTEITMPKLGESVVEGILVRWLKQPGDKVELDEPLVEVDSDKVSTDIPSPVAGTIVELRAQEGETIPVGNVICVIETEEDGSRVAPQSETAHNREEEALTDLHDNASVNRSAREETSRVTDAEPRDYDPETGHRFSPAVRRLAREHDIDPKQLTGTGAKGRVTKFDMLQAIEQRAQSSSGETYTFSDEDEVVPLTSMRRIIAERMQESVRTAPHAWTMVEVDVTDLVKWRESIKDEFRRREGVNLTYFPFVIKAAVEALKEYPIMNSMWQDDQIVIRRHINIGVAVDLEDGLIVPVIRDADQMSIAGIAKAVADLASRARSGDLRPDEVQDGTFTVNNTGAFGSILSAPIINYPQAAILSMETITRRPVVVGDGIAIRSIVNLCVSLDHRILDGAVCGRFLRSVKQRLESYHKGMPLY